MADRPHLVAVVAVDNVVTFDLGIASQILGNAEAANGDRLYDVDVCTPGGGSVRAAAGFRLTPDHGLELLEHADTIVVPGVAGPSLRADTIISPELARALQRAHARGARILSICTGAFVLAAAGLLDGRRATTHWKYAELFRSLFPAVRLNTGVLFVDEGDVLTSAGVAAGIDLCLHVLRSDHGAAVASASARRSVVAAARPGGQAQFIERPVLPVGNDGIPALLGWAAAHLDADLGLDALARRATMSVRSFTRRFRDHTGQSPAAWVAAQRLEFARELLETTGMYVDEVARRCGMGTSAQLRAAFQRHYGRSPSDYRRDFRAA